VGVASPARNGGGDVGATVGPPAAAAAAAAAVAAAAAASAGGGGHDQDGGNTAGALAHHPSARTMIALRSDGSAAGNGDEADVVALASAYSDVADEMYAAVVHGATGAGAIGHGRPAARAGGGVTRGTPAYVLALRGAVCGSGGGGGSGDGVGGGVAAAADGGDLDSAAGMTPAASAVASFAAASGLADAVDAAERSQQSSLRRLKWMPNMPSGVHLVSLNPSSTATATVGAAAAAVAAAAPATPLLRTATESRGDRAADAALASALTSAGASLYTVGGPIDAAPLATAACTSRAAAGSFMSDDSTIHCFSHAVEAPPPVSVAAAAAAADPARRPPPRVDGGGLDDAIEVSSVALGTDGSATRAYATPRGFPPSPPRLPSMPFVPLELRSSAASTLGSAGGSGQRPPLATPLGTPSGAGSRSRVAAVSRHGGTRPHAPPPLGVTSTEVATIRSITDAARRGAVAPVLSALTAHGGSLAVGAAGVWAVAHRAPQAGTLLVADGSVAALGSAYARQGRGHMSVAARVCAALARLLGGGGGDAGGGGAAAAKPDRAHTCRALSVGGVFASATAAHPQGPEVAAAACAGLAGLAAAGGGGGVPAVTAGHGALAKALYMGAADTSPGGAPPAGAAAPSALSVAACGGDLLSTIAGVRDA